MCIEYFSVWISIPVLIPIAINHQDSSQTLSRMWVINNIPYTVKYFGCDKTNAYECLLPPLSTLDYR